MIDHFKCIAKDAATSRASSNDRFARPKFSSYQQLDTCESGECTEVHSDIDLQVNGEFEHSKKFGFFLGLVESLCDCHSPRGFYGDSTKL